MERAVGLNPIRISDVECHVVRSLGLKFRHSWLGAAKQIRIEPSFVGNFVGNFVEMSAKPPQP